MGQDRVSDEEEDEGNDAPRMNTGIMSAYKYDPCVDGLRFKKKPYLCLNAPCRPNIGSIHPDGVIHVGPKYIFAPEASVQMVV